MHNYELTPPKTKGSIRTFVMDEAIMKLKVHKAKQNKIRLQKRNDSNYHDGNFVFCRKNGYPFI